MIIFSLDKTNKPASDAARQYVVDTFNAKPVLGCYDDEIELSFMVDNKHYAHIIALAAQYEQDCILLQDDRCVRLVYLDGRVERIGDGFTFLDRKPETGSYTIVDNKFMVVV